MLLKMAVKPNSDFDWSWTFIPAPYGVNYSSKVVVHPDNIPNPDSPTGYEMVREVEIRVWHDPNLEPSVFATRDTAFLINENGGTIERIN